ncbi:hypothetical protein ABZ612_14570 [Streptomyces avermitilis]|uniref:Rv1733c family protein n=1 Tax=Streptomyces avermitilis TaxID=33903 RepID=UPI0033DA2E06
MRTRMRYWYGRRNPLRRRSDVVEAWTALVVAVLLFVAAPLAGAAVGWWAYDSSRSLATAQRAERRHFSATLVENAPAAVPSVQDSKQPMYEVKVRWTEPGRGARTGPALVPAGSLRGERADVWLDSRGRSVGPPVTDTLVWQHAVTTGVWATGGVVGLVLLARIAERRIAERHRMAEWEEEWARTGPEWRNRTA